MAERPPPIVWVLFASDAALVFAYLANAAAGQPILLLTRLVNLDGEANLPAWFSSAQWLLCSMVFGLFAMRNVAWAVARSWPLVLVPALFIFLSVDEIAQAHELLGRASDALLPEGRRSSSLLPVTGVWMFVLGVPFVVFLLVLARSLRHYFSGARPALATIGLGMAVMLSGAIGVEVLSNFTTASLRLAMIQIATEEFLEMAGATVVFWGGLRLLASHGFIVRLDAAPGPPEAAAAADGTQKAARPPQNT